MMGGSSKKPNIVVVLTSQWRASACGYAGDPNAVTPHLDLLAKDGINFCEAVTPHPFGVFARAAFLTGRFSESVGIYDYYDTLPADSVTLAHRFAEAGYQTAFFGKWQLYERDPEAPVVGEEHAKVVVPKERQGGFDFWEGFESGFLLNDCFFHGSRLPEPIRIEGYQAEIIANRFLSYRSECADPNRPLFSVLSFDSPHPPYASPANGVDPKEPASIHLLDNVPKDSIIEETAKRELSGYYAHIEAMDRVVGKLVEELKHSGEWEDTLFVFSSVHGDMHGSHGHFRKGWPYEESIRVPLLMNWVNGLPRYGSDMLISLLDLGPTLLGLVDVGGDPVAFDGLNLSSEILEKRRGPDSQRISMPSVPPFAKQCPYPWGGKRSRAGIRGQKMSEAGDSFFLETLSPTGYRAPLK
ncbi:sulfatase-like hydrolase/transferase [Puniceicoccaceae bacterium K14]|nr:sulfatase-like hydrolase/transferase [Puniceicoccaceae bacterium K14]